MKRPPFVRSGPLLLLLASIAGCAVFTVPAGAQVDAAGLGIAAGTRFETYSFDDPDRVDIDHIRLLTVPIAARVQVGRMLELGISGAYARASMRRADGSEATVSGPTDTEVRATLGLADERIRLGIVGLIPTGVSELTAPEMDLAGVIAADLLPFAISNWGTGGGVGMNAAVALPLGDETAVGVSGGYVVAAEYEPLSETEFAYRPGDQLQLRAAVDRTLGGAGKVSLQVGYFRFGRDEQGGSNLYQPGDRLQILGSLAFPSGARGSGILYTGYIARDRGSYAGATRLTPEQDFVYLGGALRQPAGSRVILLPTVDVRLLDTEPGLHQGYTITAGLGLEVPVAGLEVVPTARGRYGNLTVRARQDSQFRGLDLGVTIRRRMGTR